MTTKLSRARAVSKTEPKKAVPTHAPKKAVPKKAPSVKTPPVGVDIFAFEEPEEKAPVRTSQEPREEASKPVASSESERPAGEPRPADSPSEGQTTIEALTKLEYNQLYPLWKRLNKGTAAHVFLTLRKREDLPKTRYMRKSEALHRGTVSKTPPERGALYCPYCMTYMPFHNDNYTGYTRCCGCGISTKDYHTSGDNPHA